MQRNCRKFSNRWKKIGVNKYRITDLSENWDTIIRNGGLYRATVTVTFEEYVE